MTKEEFLSKLDDYTEWLVNEEKSENTIKEYKRGITSFIEYADSQNWSEALKAGTIAYKKYLQQKYKLTTANLYIVALNKYLKYIDKGNLCVKTFKIQQKNSLEIALTMSDYTVMAKAAKGYNQDTFNMMLVLASTGVRVEELKYITVEALKNKECGILNKAKFRHIVIGEQTCDELLAYCAKKNIESGYVFFGRNPDKPICESTVLRRLKRIAAITGIDKNKVSARNLRHLFAKRYMDVVGNVTGLQNILGHSSVKTTMIYTCTTNDEKRQDMAKLGFEKI